ncbi:hypothetical protein CCY99_08005 [Helicobacter sp. 16-1353]|uniref:phosphopantetheine-binding protein n=1 Tax=Helicobacter sp. 16-1353 TaxID=2004996 RepID=UPI000DCD7921|nr:phosphopantetheine-binding protein [Helicobacter sp. 16-1353]RAX51894.1 hypothetical protein CCY99_08005 [Helicobacter sp. 16-1353]
MTKKEFLNELSELLQREEPCNENDILESYEEWDSLSKMSLMAFFAKHFSIQLTLKQLNEAKSILDLIALASGNIK